MDFVAVIRPAALAQSSRVGTVRGADGHIRRVTGIFLAALGQHIENLGRTTCGRNDADNDNGPFRTRSPWRSNGWLRLSGRRLGIFRCSDFKSWHHRSGCPVLLRAKILSRESVNRIVSALSLRRSLLTRTVLYAATDMITAILYNAKK